MKKEEQSFCCGISVSQKRHALSGWILRFVPLFAMLFATLAAKAASDGDGVKFNSGVRYSQWAINSRLHDFYGNTKLFGFDVYDANNTKKSTVQWKNDKKANIDKSFDYVAGLVAKATLEAADYYAGFDWSKPWFYSAQAFANEVTYSNSSKPTLDAMNAVKMYFPILSSSLKSDNVVTKANTALAALAEDMKTYNKTYSIGGSKSTLDESNASDAQKKMFGGWFHKSSDYVDQMWLDGAYMGSATLAQLTGYLGDSKNIFGSKEADWNMVAKQLNIVWNQCWDSNKQLMYHAFSATGAATASKSTKDTWAGISNSADAPVYHSAAFWGRANSWYLFALVDALEAMKNDNQENTENYKTLKGHLDSFAAGIVKWQDQTTGGWYQVMDEKGDYNASGYNSSYRWTSSYNNYIETSATAIFSAALFKAVRLGLLGDTYKNAAKKAFEGIVNNFVAPKADGTINIWSSSRSAGLGGSYYRDGSKIYYILGKDTKIVTKEDNLTEGKVLGGFIMAATEYERAYQNQDNASILFSYDLQPSYDLTQSSVTAPKVEVCGTDADQATYRWYDATTNAAVAGATEASFTPSATGNYYCKATVGSTSIQTSTTYIKVNSGGGETGGETTPETLFSYDVPASGDLSTTDTNEGVTGGKIMFASSKNEGDKYKIDGDAKYVKVTLSGNSLKAGDVISVKASASNSGYGCFAALDTEKKSSLKLGNLTGKSPEDISYTVTEKDILNGQSSFYLFRDPGKSIYVHSITITRKTTTQTTSPLVIAVEDVEMNVTDEVTKQPEVKVYGTGDKQLTPGTDYTLSFSTDNNNVTVNESGVFKAAGSKFNYIEGVTTVTVTATPSAALAGQYKEATSTFTFTVRKGKMKPVFMSAFKGATIKVKKGTKKTIEVPLNYGGEDVSGYFDVKYSCSALSKLTSSNNTMTYTFSTAGKYQIKVSATPKIVNQDKDDEFDYADEYYAPDNVTFTVDVSGDYTVPTVTLDPSTSKTIYVGEVVDAPAVRVTDASGTAIDNSKYKMEWTSFAPDVCKVDAATGKIEGVSAGDNVKIQLKVSGEGYEDVFAYLLVSVDDPAKYRVKAPGSKEPYSPMTPLFNQNNTLAVTLGGWIFTDRTKDVPVSKEDLTYGDKNKWADDSSKATWVIKGFDYYLPGLTCQNARQEDGACPLPSETQWYDGKLQEVKGGTVDPMFYVPCSGAYLTVEPKTNGKVSVSVFQNGVFDKSDGVYAYRPQRRVFVLDEAGNVVASEATISATGGKLTVANKKATGDLADPYKITNYPCNITGLATGPATTGGGKDSNPSPTKEEVMKHFRGMTSFDMSATGFQNNVYESNIDNQATWGDNATPNNGAHDNVMGSHGWSVLVDAAVTYTFDVKAGKTYYIYNYGSKLGFYGFSFDEAKGQPVTNYEFNDDATNTIVPTKAGKLTTAKVNRAMKAGVWTTCVLPFSLNKQQVDAIFGKTYDRDHLDGTQILYFDHVEGTKAIFVRHAYNNIVAGKPFLIKPTKEVTSINTAEVTAYPYVTIENTKPAEWCSGNGYVWMSSYSNDLTVKEGDCFISNNDGSFKNFVGTQGTLKGFRGYLKHIGTNGVSEAKKLTVGMGSNVTSDETSAIDGILIDGDMPADSVTAADGKVYNLNGQVVATSYRQFQALPGGVYVVNGKKVVK